MNKKQLQQYKFEKQIWKLSSLKMGKLMWCESLLERNFLLTLENNNNVIRYETQPFSTVYKGEDHKKKRYTPDVLVEYQDGFKLFEVKPEEFVIHKLIAKLAMINRHLVNRNHPKVEIRTENDIGDEITIRNMNILYRYKQISIEKCVESKLMECFEAGMSLRSLYHKAIEKGHRRNIVLALIAHGFLSFDMTALLNRSTTLEIVNA